MEKPISRKNTFPHFLHLASFLKLNNLIGITNISQTHEETIKRTAVVHLKAAVQTHSSLSAFEVAL